MIVGYNGKLTLTGNFDIQQPLMTVDSHLNG